MTRGVCDFNRKSSAGGGVAEERPSGGRRVRTFGQQRDREPVALAVGEPPRLRVGVHVSGDQHQANGCPASGRRVGPKT